MIERIPVGAKPPPIRWWGNVFYRMWKDREQLVIVLRLPWWRGAEPIILGGMLSVWTHASRREQLTLSWRQGEGWRKGWRPV
jgi:hypothetical protein